LDAVLEIFQIMLKVVHGFDDRVRLHVVPVKSAVDQVGNGHHRAPCVKQCLQNLESAPAAAYNPPLAQDLPLFEIQGERLETAVVDLIGCHGFAPRENCNSALPSRRSEP